MSELSRATPRRAELPASACIRRDRRQSQIAQDMFLGQLDTDRRLVARMPVQHHGCHRCMREPSVVVMSLSWRRARAA